MLELMESPELIIENRDTLATSVNDAIKGLLTAEAAAAAINTMVSSYSNQ